MGRHLCYTIHVSREKKPAGPGGTVRIASNTKEAGKQMEVVKMITEDIKLLAAVISLIAAWVNPIKKK